MFGISSNTEVTPLGKMHEVGVSNHLLGKILDGLGRPFDGAQSTEPSWYPVYRDAPPPMKRKLIEKADFSGGSFDRRIAYLRGRAKDGDFCSGWWW